MKAFRDEHLGTWFQPLFLTFVASLGEELESGPAERISPDIAMIGELKL